MSTALVSLAELLWLLRISSLYVGGNPFAMPRFSALAHFGRRSGAEWVRLASYHLSNNALILILGSSPAWVRILSVYSVASLFMWFALMPLIALMRTLSMVIAARLVDQTKSLSTGLRLTKHVALVAGVVSLLGAGLLYGASSFLGREIYGLAGMRLQWWHAFTDIFALTLPVYCGNAVLKADFQALGRFSYLAVEEIVIVWAVFLPMVLVSLDKGDALLFFGAFAVWQVLEMVALLWGLSGWRVDLIRRRLA